MLAASPVRLLRRSLALFALSLIYGCNEPSAPLAPRLDPTPHTLVGTVAIVTNTDDDGPGSLRQTMKDAASGTTIQFDPSISGQTIVLTSGAIVENDKALTIDGGSTGMTISGGLTSRVLIAGASADLVFRNLMVVDGRSDDGGAVQAYGKVTFDHSLLANNESTGSGGAIAVESNGTLTLLNSTLSGNGAAVVGGAISSSGVVVIRNATIAFNTAGDGGGVWASSGALSLRNSIVANNIDDDDTNATNPNCVVKSGVDAVFLGRNIANEDPCDPTMTEANPVLAPLANNGGPTKTHAVGASSAAIDAGISCTEATDQRYVARPQGSSCDVGAFEFNDFGRYTLTIGPNIGVNAKTGIATVAGTIACSKPTTLPLLKVELSQTQKTTGRFTTIVQGTGFVGGMTCGTSPSSWSVAFGPQVGKFEPGSATGTATTSITLGTFLPATVTSTLKVFQVK